MNGSGAISWRRGALRFAYCTLLGCLALPAWAVPPPGFEAVRASRVASEAWVLDRRGRPLHTLRADPHNRRLPWIPLAELSPAMIDALIASEDRRFRSHAGVDWQAMVGALWSTLVEGHKRGGSTLTMQLVGLIDPSLRRDADGRDMGQKLRQIQAAQALEKRWSKEQILEAYLNLADFRGELVGIAAAAQGLFGKHPSGLDRAEASLLAALLRGPNAKPALAVQRACGVARKIGLKDCNTVNSRVLGALLRPPRVDMNPQLAPHLARKLDVKPGQSQRTTLDADVQAFAVETLRRHLAELRDRQVEDGALLVLDNASGEVLAWVGASDRTSRAAEVDGVTAPRLPGSTLKPFLYGLAFERGLLTPASPLEDSPLALDTPLGQYAPQNYERDFKGWVSARNALGASLNVPAVRVLELLGVERFLEGLRRLGLTSLDEDGEFYGYALALGGGETTLLELANAYRALANGGARGPVTWLPPGQGAQARKHAPTARALTREAAWLVSDILADKGARALTFGLASPLETAGYAAVKTGTSKDMRDNWCIGYSDRYTVAVWVGNASGEPMRDVSGVSGAAPVWQAVMNRLHAGRPSLAPKRPRGVESRRVTFEPAIEPPRREWFIAGTAQSRIVLPPADAPLARIQGPGNGAILARDPDIPAERQKVRFSHTGGSGLKWRIDGASADPAWLQADGSLRWPPAPGAHRVSLHAADESELDAQFVTVK